jgi:hypothetical protein
LPPAHRDAFRAYPYLIATAASLVTGTTFLARA